MPDHAALDLLRHRILSFYREAQQLKAGEMPRPRMAIYHPTYRCNHNCPGCDFRVQNAEIGEVVDPAKSTRLVEQMLSLGVAAVEFSGGGEPLLHRGIVADVEQLRSHGAAIGLITNGSLLEGAVLDAFVDHAAYIRVGLDAGSRETYNRVKGINSPTEFDRILTNIRAAVARRRDEQRTLDISVKFTVGKNNFTDMEEAVRLAADLEVDAIQFKFYENVDSIQIREEGQAINKLEKDAGDLQRLLEEIRRRHSGHLGRTRILGDLVRTRLNRPCWLNPIITLIDGLGDVYICSYYRHRMDSHRLGNLFAEDFVDLWFSEKHRERVAAIEVEACNLYSCRFHRYNDIMEALMAAGHDHLRFI